MSDTSFVSAQSRCQERPRGGRSRGILMEDGGPKNIFYRPMAKAELMNLNVHTLDFSFNI